MQGDESGADFQHSSKIQRRSESRGSQNWISPCAERPRELSWWDVTIQRVTIKGGQSQPRVPGWKTGQGCSRRIPRGSLWGSRGIISGKGLRSLLAPVAGQAGGRCWG